ncbi:MAG: hypothetical protein EBZ77_15890 [Chitinophagia bacterium]|nr:hypothetical protein [Chitinophagia bacterium]
MIREGIDMSLERKHLVMLLQNGLSHFYRVILKYLLIQFIKYNSNFGKKRYIVDNEFYNRKVYRVSFDDNHIKYVWPIHTNFTSSHLNCCSRQYQDLMKENSASKAWINMMNNKIDNSDDGSTESVSGYQENNDIDEDDDEEEIDYGEEEEEDIDY